jgi:hypothetical protein
MARFRIFLGRYAPTVVYQYARPAADVTDGAWLNELGSATHLYSSIDETTASDADYIYTMSASTCEVALGALNDPGVGSDHIVRYRAKGDGSTDLIVTLRQGASTTIATWTEANASSTMTTYEHTLTTGEADNITDYTDLRLRFEAA